MVDTTYLMTKMLEIGNTGKSLKVSSSREDSDDFRSMLDKNTQKAEQKDTNAKAEDTKTESRQNPAQTEGKEESKAPEVDAEAGASEENTALQEMMQQCAMANEQKLALNWAEDSAQQTDGAAQAVTEIVGEDTAGLEQNGVQSQQQLTETPVQQEVAKPTTQQSLQQEQAVQQQEAQPKQEQKADVTQQTEVQMAEGKDIQVTVQKGAESQSAADEQQSDTPEAKTETTTDAAALQKAAPQEENLVQVKVGETVNLSEPKAAEQLADSVLVKVQENTNEYEMQLSPEELGTIKIKLVLENGRIHVSMFCENQKAADLLGLTSERLRGILEERTGNEAYVEVQKEDANPYNEQEKEKDQNGRGYEGSRKQGKKDGEAVDFMQQLRLGLIDLQE